MLVEGGKRRFYDKESTGAIKEVILFQCGSCLKVLDEGIVLPPFFTAIFGKDWHYCPYCGEKLY